MQQYQVNCYRHRGLKACRVCIPWSVDHNWALLGNVSRACVAMTTLLRSVLPHFTVTCISKTSEAQDFCKKESHYGELVCEFRFTLYEGNNVLTSPCHSVLVARGNSWSICTKSYVTEIFCEEWACHKLLSEVACVIWYFTQAFVLFYNS
jgi:hypothetical protein